MARALAERIEDLAAQLLPGARRDGRLLRCGSLAGEVSNSLVVHLAGPRRGRWHEYNGGIGGDALDLVAQTKFAGDIRAALVWAPGWLGLDHHHDPIEIERQRERARAIAQESDRTAEDHRQRRRAEAKRIWLAAAPLREGDLVDRYLRGRGIDLSSLSRLPGALRCHPTLYHAKSGRAWPAMVAAIAAADGVHVATQRTWLKEQRDGSVTKAPLGPDAKMTLGPFRHAGGAVHLTRGISGLPWQLAPEGEAVAFSEGIEDGLTFATIRPDLRVAACSTSLAYLAHVALPPRCGEVVVIGQNDRRGSDAMRAQASGIASLRARGIAVSVFRPPVFVKDINEYATWLRRMPEQAALDKSVAF